VLCHVIHALDEDSSVNLDEVRGSKRMTHTIAQVSEDPQGSLDAAMASAEDRLGVRQVLSLARRLNSALVGHQRAQAADCPQRPTVHGIHGRAPRCGREFDSELFLINVQEQKRELLGWVNQKLAAVNLDLAQDFTTSFQNPKVGPRNRSRAQRRVGALRGRNVTAPCGAHRFGQSGRDQCAVLHPVVRAAHSKPPGNRWRPR
jgi:hypothetical protein